MAERKALKVLAETVLTARSTLLEVTPDRAAELVASAFDTLDRASGVAQAIIDPAGTRARRDAGRKGGLTTAKRHGAEFYSRIGKMGREARDATRKGGAV